MWGPLALSEECITWFVISGNNSLTHALCDLGFAFWVFLWLSVVPFEDARWPSKQLIAGLGGGALWHSQRFLQYIKYIILEFTPPLFSFIPPPLIAGIIQQVSVFHLHACCTFFAPYSPSYPLSPPPTPSTWCQPSPPISVFVWNSEGYKDKKTCRSLWPSFALSWEI
jgi:hypothetical protein